MFSPKCFRLFHLKASLLQKPLHTKPLATLSAPFRSLSTSINYGALSQKKAFTFDANGVLYKRNLKAIARLESVLSSARNDGHQISEPMPHQLEELKKLRYSADTGILSKDKYYDTVLDLYGIKSEEKRNDLKSKLKDADGQVLLYDGVATTLNKLQQSGYKLGVITNTISSTDEKLYWLKRAGLAISWDAFVSSSEVGYKKPQPAIYQAALARLQVAPQDAVFVGHEQDEIDGAKAVGMSTVLVHGNEGASADHVLNNFSELLYLVRIG